MAKKISLRITTPTKDPIVRETDSFHFSTELGEIEILPDHQSFASNIPYSILNIKIDNVVESYAIRRGILYFDNKKNQVSISCLEVLEQEEIDFINYKEYLKYINQQLETHTDKFSYKYKYLENEKLALVKMMNESEN